MSFQKAFDIEIGVEYRMIYVVAFFNFHFEYNVKKYNSVEY